MPMPGDPIDWLVGMPAIVVPEVAFEPTRKVITCGRCPTAAEVRGYHLQFVQDQIRLYQEGWRQVWREDTGVNFCPGCVTAAGGPPVHP